MFLGLSFLAMKLQVVPTRDEDRHLPGRPRVFGGGPLGYALFLALQVATMLILVLAANTWFADFPRLASFHAGDDFMPRQLTNARATGSSSPTASSRSPSRPRCWSSLFQADVTHLIPLYAIGVFTSFTLSQAGMAKRHLRSRSRAGVAASRSTASAPSTTGVVTVVIAITKFPTARGPSWCSSR